MLEIKTPPRLLHQSMWKATPKRLNSLTTKPPLMLMGKIDPQPTSGEKDGEAERKEEKKGQQVEEAKSCETERGGEEMTGKNKEKKKSQKEGASKEADADGKAAKEAEKTKQVEEVDVETKEKAKIKEVEKQGKPKRKSGPPSSSLSRPRPSARSMRAAAKNDIIAKFQQGAPE